jgi:MerR family transcriptional regulator, light-induced transcriptional regulator
LGDNASQDAANTTDGATMSDSLCVTSSASDDLRAKLDGAFGAHDADAAVTAVLAALDSGPLEVEELYCAVLVPALAEIGRRWHDGKMRVWEEHLDSAAARAVVEAMRPRVAACRQAVIAEHAGAEPMSALFACPPKEFHVLGLRMMADRFAMHGWRTFYLGADVPLEEIVDAAKTLKVQLLVLNAATTYERLYLRDVIAGLRAQLPGVRILGSGPAFSAEHEDWSAEELADPEQIPDPYA